MIYILIAVIVLLIVNLVLSVYILKEMNVSNAGRMAQLDLLKCMVDYYDEMSTKLEEMDRRNVERFDDFYEALKNVDMDIQSAKHIITTNQLDEHQTLQSIESFMDISKNTQIEICEKLKKPEIDIVPVAKAYDVLAVAFDSESIPEVDWEPLIKQALLHLGAFLIENDEEEPNEEIHD